MKFSTHVGSITLVAGLMLITLAASPQRRARIDTITIGMNAVDGTCSRTRRRGTRRISLNGQFASAIQCPHIKKFANRIVPDTAMRSNPSARLARTPNTKSAVTASERVYARGERVGVSLPRQSLLFFSADGRRIRT